MNLEFATSVYTMLTYLTSDFCNPEDAMSKRIKEVSK